MQKSNGYSIKRALMSLIKLSVLSMLRISICVSYGNVNLCNLFNFNGIGSKIFIVYFDGSFIVVLQYYFKVKCTLIC